MSNIEIIPAGGRESFANILRGIASLSVLVAHYLGGFNVMRGEYAGFPPLAVEPFPYWSLVTLQIPNLNYGPFGVALFFLVSGFVISLLIARLSEGNHWRKAFLVARIYRIWPTYWIGLSITIISFCIAAKINGIPCPVAFSKALLQAVTLTDQVGDGVVWTLGIEIKFYALALLFAGSILRGSYALFLFLALLSIVESHFGSLLPYTDKSVTPRYVLYMLCGVSFALHYRGVFSSKRMLLMAGGAYGVFALCSDIELQVNYLLALLSFAAMYKFRDRIRSNMVLEFFANISYPLYVCHAAMGYVGLRIMIGAGVPPLLSFALQVALSISIAYAIHRLVEEPTHRAGKSKAKRFLLRTGTTKQAAQA